MTTRCTKFTFIIIIIICFQVSSRSLPWQHCSHREMLCVAKPAPMYGRQTQPPSRPGAVPGIYVAQYREFESTRVATVRCAQATAATNKSGSTRTCRDRKIGDTVQLLRAAYFYFRSVTWSIAYVDQNRRGLASGPEMKRPAPPHGK